MSSLYDETGYRFIRTANSVGEVLSIISSDEIAFTTISLGYDFDEGDSATVYGVGTFDFDGGDST